MTKPIFLTLQRGDNLFCLRLGMPHLALAASVAILTGTWFMPEPPADPQTLTESKWRIAALQSELEKSVSQHGVTSELLNTRLADALHRLARIDAQENALQSLEAKPMVADQRLRDLDKRLSRIERKQITRLQEATHERVTETRAIEGALKQAGLQVVDPPDDAKSAQGGPFIPLSEAVSAPFAKEWARAEPLFARHASLTSLLPTLPLRPPLAGPMEVTSGFGARMDPFHGRAAWHTGIDFRQEVGSDVLAAAAGTVTTVARNGAYGLMVDIDHGNGLSTRYAHLSRSLVREGEIVQAQTAIGRSGASGRTTGAHLHYELRINGEPTNPARLIKAGQMISGLLNTSSQMGDAAQ